jgi:hypothetical protein
LNEIEFAIAIAEAARCDLPKMRTVGDATGAEIEAAAACALGDCPAAQ